MKDTVYKKMLLRTLTLGLVLGLVTVLTNAQTFEPRPAKEAGLIKPRNGITPKKKRPQLPPEGTLLVDQLCKVEIDPSGWVLLMFPEEKGREAQRPRWALPNGYLEEIERRVKLNPAVQFRISGETTVYNENLFLLIRRIAIVEPVSVSEKVRPVTPATEPANQATTKPAESTAKTPPTSKDLMEAMLAERNPTPVILPNRKAEVDARDVPSVAPVTGGKVLEPARGSFIIDRVVTLRDAGVGNWKQLVFDGDNSLLEPPVRIMPCQFLKRIEKMSVGTKVRVTGEVYNYKGQRFIRIRKVLKERRMGQL